jgi:hypothetical protein
MMEATTESAAASPSPFAAAAPTADVASSRPAAQAAPRSRRADLEAMAFGDADMFAAPAPRAELAAHEAAHVVQQRQGALFAGQYN